jgi:hypothetical protein
MSYYGTVDGGDAYFAARLFSWDWSQATGTDKAKALQHAADLIDQFDYIGQKYAVAILGEDADEATIDDANLSQPNEFPRGIIFEVPWEVEQAAYLIAQKLLSGRDPDLDLEGLAVKAERYGSVSSSYDREGNTQEHLAHLIPSPQAFNLLRPFFRQRNVFQTKRM